MQTMKQAAAGLLAGKRVAVTGVSRHPKGHGSDVVYQRLRQRGYAVNPNPDQVEGDRCHHDVTSIRGGVDWVVIGTRPETADATMRECAELGIERVWMQRGPVPGACRILPLNMAVSTTSPVIEGGCPCMSGPTADPGRKVMRLVLTMSGNVPRRL
jgi:predicted CoA-binding protein